MKQKKQKQSFVRKAVLGAAAGAVLVVMEYIAYKKEPEWLTDLKDNLEETREKQEILK